MKEKIFKNFSLKILSAVGALVLWTVIVNIYDPTTSVTISNVAVELQNTESLTDNDYTYEVVDGSRINVYIRGPKSIITELKSSDIVATADLSKITAFADYVDINVKVVKDGRELNNVEVIPRTTAVRLQIENRLTKEFTVKYDTDGNPEDGCIISNVSIFPDVAKVTGSSSAVGKIASARVTLNTSGRNNDFSENVPIRLLANDGSVIEDDTLVLSRGDADCVVSISKQKTVRIVSAGYTGKPSVNYLVRGIELSENEIEITGPVSVVEGINEITIPASAIDVTGLASDKVVSVNLSDYVDASVSFSSDSSITVTARIVSENSKEIEVPVSKVRLNNLAPGLKAALDTSVQTLNISVKNNEEESRGIDSDDISLSVNLASLSVGEHIVTVNVVVPEGYSVDGVYRVKVIIERDQQSTTGTEGSTSGPVVNGGTGNSSGQQATTSTAGGSSIQAGAGVSGTTAP